MIPSASPSAVLACCSFGVTSWDTSAVEISAEISRSSMTRTATRCPRWAARAVTRSAVRSASSRVEDGSLVPALTTTSRNGSPSRRTGAFMSGCPRCSRNWGRPPGRAGGPVEADGLELAELGGGQPGGHGLGHAARVPPPDLALPGPARRGERQPDAPPVGRVGLALHEAALGQPVHQAGQGWLSSTCRFSSLIRTGSAHLDSVYSTSYSRMECRPRCPRPRTASSARRGRTAAPPTRRWRGVCGGHHSSGCWAWRPGRCPGTGTSR